MATADFSELRAFADQIARGVKISETAKVVTETALEVRDQLRSEAGKSRHFRMAGQITHTMRAGGLDAEIGPEKRGAGNLAAIAYFGGAHGGGATVPDPKGALETHAPNLEKALGELGEQVGE